MRQKKIISVILAAMLLSVIAVAQSSKKPCWSKRDSDAIPSKYVILEIKKIAKLLLFNDLAISFVGVLG